jgi:WD40 repeat protein
MENYYKVGGALRYDHPSYVARQADRQLYNLLKMRETCFVLNSRQMGKSSLKARISRQLRADNIKYAGVDLTLLGSHAEQDKWYQGFAFQLLSGLELETNKLLSTWWPQYSHLTETQRLEKLIKSVISEQIPQNIVIFIDEIDSIIQVPFKDDFFALIRACYNLRAEDPDFFRLSFCLLGVAAPTDLIQDKSRTPFNIGQSIELTGFTFAEARDALLPGLKPFTADPEATLKAILDWTGGQPFLTQKLCKLVVQHAQDNHPDVAAIAQNYIIQYWETQDTPEHLRTIRDRLLVNEHQAVRILGIYQHLLSTQSNQIEEMGVLADDSDEQATLRLSGMVVKRNRYLQIYNPIYQAVFNPEWVQDQLNHLRPYHEALNAWIHYNQSPDHLLQGQTLADAQAWAIDKSLSNIDHQFLAKSQAKQDQKANQILAVAQKKLHQSVILFGTTSVLALALTIGASLFAWHRLNYAQESIQLEKDGVNAEQLGQSNPLDGLLSALQTGQRLKVLVGLDTPLTQYPTVRPVTALMNLLPRMQEYNQLVGHQKVVRTLSFSPDGQVLASGSDDGTLKLWQRTGKLIKTMKLSGSINSVQFSPNGQFIATATRDGSVQLWKPNGTLIRTIVQREEAIWSVSISPDSKRVAVAGQNGVLGIWNLAEQYTYIQSAHHQNIFAVSFSPDGKTLAASDNSGSTSFWNLDGTLIKTLAHTHWGTLNAIAFSPDGNLVATAGVDTTVKLWSREGKLINELTGYKDSVLSVHFSPDGQFIVTGSLDGTLKLWTVTGSLLQSFTLNKQIYGVAFSPDGQTLASSNEEGLIQLWRVNRTAITPLSAHDKLITSISFSPDGQRFATSSLDGTVKVWNWSEIVERQQGHGSKSVITTPWKTLTINGSNLVNQVRFSPDGQTLAAGSDTGLVSLWRSNGTPIKTWQTNHRGAITTLSFFSKGQGLATGSDDGTIQLWQKNSIGFTSLPRDQHEIKSEVTSLSSSPDGKVLATSYANGTIQLRNREGRLLKTFHEPNAIAELSFSPDGKTLVVGGDSSAIKRWQTDGSRTQSFAGQNRNVTSVAYSADGNMIVASYGDGSIKVWKSDGTLLLPLKVDSGWGTSVRFGPDGKTLVAGMNDGTVMVWSWNLDTLMAQGCHWLKDYFVSHPRKLDALTVCQ